MKKFFVFALTACLLLTGCGDDEPEEVPQEKPSEIVEKPSPPKPAKSPEVVKTPAPPPVRRNRNSETPAEFYMDRATENYINKKYREAVSDANEAVRLDPTNIDAYVYRGYIQSALGNYRAAIADLTKVIELDPKNIDAYAERGVAFANMGDYNNAVADFDKAIALDPLDPDNYENRGIVFGNMGNFGKALEDFDRVIALRPTVEAYQKRGKCHEALGDAAKAQADFAKARELSQ